MGGYSLPDPPDMEEEYYHDEDDIIEDDLELHDMDENADCDCPTCEDH